jgi:hypothetical protein
MNVLTPHHLNVLSTFSSIVFSFPSSKEQNPCAEALCFGGFLVREKCRDDRLGVDRWAYKRTETGSTAIGASCV